MRSSSRFQVIRLNADSDNSKGNVVRLLNDVSQLVGKNDSLPVRIFFGLPEVDGTAMDILAKISGKLSARAIGIFLLFLLCFFQFFKIGSKLRFFLSKKEKLS